MKTKEQRHAYYLKNRERIIAYSASWRKNNPERARAWWAKYRKTHHEKITAYWKSKNSTKDGFLKTRFQVYRKTSESRGLQFNISFSQFSEFWKTECFYCGTIVEKIGLDRVDNARGYVEGNIVSCCRDCNVAKNALSFEAFINLCEKVTARHRKLKGGA